MPKLSKDSAPNVRDLGPAVDQGGDLDDITVNFVTIKETHSLAPLLRGLPGDSCQCPHWGYLFAGKITVSYADREETYQAGDAFFSPPQRAKPVDRFIAGDHDGPTRRPAERWLISPGFFPNQARRILQSFLRFLTIPENMNGNTEEQGRVAVIEPRESRRISTSHLPKQLQVRGLPSFGLSLRLISHG